METALAASVPWIPEDDLLLKNAVEAGASLEALAKGAVQFSRKYTLQELRERWHSLLYDPDVLALASDRMFELEISGFNPAPKLTRSENNFLGNKEASRKRKLGSIRRKYYAMRKKLQKEFFNNIDNDIGFFEPNQDKNMMLDGNPLGQNSVLGDGMPDHLRLQEDDLVLLRHAFPETISDIAVSSTANNSSQGVDIKNSKSSIALQKSLLSDDNLKNSSVGFEGRQPCTAPNSDGYSFQGVFASGSPNLHHWGTMRDFSAPTIRASMRLKGRPHFTEDIDPNDVEGKESSSGLCTGEFADPDSLLNLSNEDEILSQDANVKNEDSAVCMDNTDSVLQDSDKSVQENAAATAELEAVIVSEPGPIPAQVEIPVVSSSSAHADQPINLRSSEVPLKSTSGSDFGELSENKICCVLNTEDTEIPCNDDIFLLIHNAPSFGSFTQPFSSASMDTSAAAHAKNSEQTLSWSMKVADSTKALRQPQKVGLHGLPEFNAGEPFVGRGAKIESHDSASQELPGFAGKAIGNSSKSRSHHTILKPLTTRQPEKEVARVDRKASDSPTTTTVIMGPIEGSYGGAPLSEPAHDSSASDHEESEIDEEDDDMPFFSDIEAMILDMDLDPYDQDSYVATKVPSYQYDGTKRTIIRLEQGARTYLQRVMTSRGALAILYGRHLRHYIKKTEVLLGRSTDDVRVDIDLRQEGRANKISRRQAIIKMEADGSFFLKNLGKSFVSVNGMTVATGQLVSLSPSCLIEIKGMSFVFEINQGYVKKQLAHLCLKNKGKKLDWSREDE